MEKVTTIFKLNNNNSYKITHNLGTRDIITAIYDEDNTRIEVQETIIDENTMQISLNGKLNSVIKVVIIG